MIEGFAESVQDFKPWLSVAINILLYTKVVRFQDQISAESCMRIQGPPHGLAGHKASIICFTIDSDSCTTRVYHNSFFVTCSGWCHVCWRKAGFVGIRWRTHRCVFGCNRRLWRWKYLSQSSNKLHRWWENLQSDWNWTQLIAIMRSLLYSRTSLL